MQKKLTLNSFLNKIRFILLLNLFFAIKDNKTLIYLTVTTMSSFSSQNICIANDLKALR